MFAALETGMATESACNPLTGEKINNRIKYKLLYRFSDGGWKGKN